MPTSDIVLTKAEARRFLLSYQGLRPPRSLQGEDSILDYIRRVGCIQFDPLDIVGRNPSLVLQSRVADYRPQMLDRLLYERRELLDGWDKNMAIYSVMDWPYFRRYREAERRRLGNDERPAVAILPEVRRELQERGPLSSIDLDHDQVVDWSWSSTRIARAALESMYAWGELIVHHKVHTRKVYDFASNHIARELLDAPEPNPDRAEYHDWRILRRIGGIGLVWDKAGVWLGMGGIKARARSESLARLQQQGRVVAVQVEGSRWPFFMRAEDQPRLDAVRDGDDGAAGDGPQLAAILAPLDNLIWDRRMIDELFGFMYVWEVYKPVDQRLYGYYVLPILYGDRFVARCEPARDKESGALLIKGWWWEDGVAPSTDGTSADMRLALIDCFRRFIAYLGLDGLTMEPEIAESADLGWLLDALGSADGIEDEA